MVAPAVGAVAAGGARVGAQVGATSARLAANGVRAGARIGGKALATGARSAGHGAKAGAQKAGQGAKAGARSAGHGAKAGVQKAGRPAGRRDSRGPSRGGPNGKRQPGPIKRIRDANDHLQRLDRGSNKDDDKNNGKQGLRKLARNLAPTQGDDNSSGDADLAGGLKDEAGETTDRLKRGVDKVKGALGALTRLLVPGKTPKKGPVRRGLRVVALLVVLLILLAVIGLPAALMNAEQPDGGGDGSISAGGIVESTEIPLEAAHAYVSAADAYDMDWAVLAGVGWRECTHGQSTAEGCNPDITSNCTYSTNEAQEGHPCTARDGEQGPMQFMANTWRKGTPQFDRDRDGPPAADGEGYATDGSGNGRADPFDWFDAAHASARYLVELGVNEDEVRALNRYNGISQGSQPTSYSGAVMDKVEEYRSQVPAYDDVELTADLSCPSSVQPLGGTERVTEPDRITEATQTMLDSVVPCFGRTKGIGCFDPRDGSGRSRPVAGSGGSGEHPRGRACDLMMACGGCTAEGEHRRHGEAMAKWLVANADELNVLYVIWNREIWSSSRRGEGWRPYSGDSPHVDHVHVSIQLMSGDPGWARCGSAGGCYE